jgi:uncharacterized protein YecE (DUF72 family)
MIPERWCRFCNGWSDDWQGWAQPSWLVCPVSAQSRMPQLSSGGECIHSESPMTTRIGLAGWSYPDWKGRVYPAKPPRGFDPLAYLAGYFDTIEINSTFYRIPTVKTTRDWASRVAGNPGFKFTAKLPQAFTHIRQPNAQDEAALKAALAPLHDVGRLGALLLQFPYAFHHTPANRAYLHQLVECFRDYPLVLEVRHRSWDVPSAYEFLLDCCDLGWSIRIRREPYPAAWQITAQRHGRLLYRGITAHGRTPRAFAATHAPVADRRPQWCG